MKQSIKVITHDKKLAIIPLTISGEIKIYWNHTYSIYELIYIPLDSPLDLVLYESKYEEEILEARNYLFEKLSEDKTFIDLSDMLLDLVEED